MRNAARWLGVWASLAIASTASAAAAPPIELTVNATDAPRGVFHSTMHIPAAPGRLDLAYPKWVQGEHAPFGPITQVAGLKISAAGTTIPWRRDPVELFRISVVVPAKGDGIDLEFDYLSPPSVFGAGYGETPNATGHLVIVDWHDLLFYPADAAATDVSVQATLRLPRGWALETALPGVTARGESVAFPPTTLETLIDSPVLAGDTVRSFELGQPGNDVRLFVAADRPTALAIPEARLHALQRLPAEALALFGARHYRRYRWLLALANPLDSNGLEHHESSDDRGDPRMFITASFLLADATLLPHEYVHSWNGKYRRPLGLATRNPGEPLRDELLWVYEGLTRYLGDLVLATRSGIRSLTETRDYLAWIAANQERNRPGRRWRPLVDTATSAAVLQTAPRAWSATRRALDYYDEAGLVWLEADAFIRRSSAGRRSLDDFCRAFFGGADTGPAVRPYSRAELMQALAAIAPRDWEAFFAARVDVVAPAPPLGGLAATGWKLTYNATPNAYQAARADWADLLDESFALGVWLKADGTVIDLDIDSPAWQAGLGPGLKILAINHRPWSTTVLNEELGPGEVGKPLVLTAEDGDQLREFMIAKNPGVVYPHLEPNGEADLLAEILAPKAAPPVGKP